MRSNYHGDKRKHSFFEGWYFKHQKGNQVLALIPGMNRDHDGNPSAFIQLIWDTESYFVPYPFSAFKADQNSLKISIGESIFSQQGITLHIETEILSIHGQLHYQAFTPIKYDIMGPFACVPYMQCNHGIISLSHKVEGQISINSQKTDWNGSIGYLEKDWGTSFPKNYLWLQCNDFSKEPCCLFVSAADIPIGKLHFQGLIALFYYDGQEYRFASYNGGKIQQKSSQEIILTRGSHRLEIHLSPASAHELIAPSMGSMNRTIHENTSCQLHGRFIQGRKILCSFHSDHAIFEYVTGD